MTSVEIGFPRDVAPYSFLARPAISPDGRTVAMVGVRDGGRRVFVRRLDRAEADELPDTLGATGAVFSPNGASVAVVFTSGLITRISLVDQPRSAVASGVDTASSVTWNEAGIVFGRGLALWVVSPEGGEPRSLTVLDAARHEVAHEHPAGFTDTRVVSAGRDGAALALALARGTRARLTAPGAQALFSTWAADGTRVVFSQFGVQSWAAADGSGNAGAIPGATAIDYPSSPGPNADSIIAVGIRPETAGDVFLLSISGASEPKPLIVTPAYEGGAQLSPDGRWLLYQSDASGQPEIYVRRYPALDRQWQVSEGGGVQARWSRSSREIFYRSGQRMRGSLRPVTDGSGPRLNQGGWTKRERPYQRHWRGAHAILRP